MLEMNTCMHTLGLILTVCMRFACIFSPFPIISMIMNSNRLFNSRFKYEF